MHQPGFMRFQLPRVKQPAFQERHATINMDSLRRQVVVYFRLRCQPDLPLDQVIDLLVQPVTKIWAIPVSHVACRSMLGITRREKKFNRDFDMNRPV